MVVRLKQVKKEIDISRSTVVHYSCCLYDIACPNWKKKQLAWVQSCNCFFWKLDNFNKYNDLLKEISPWTKVKLDPGNLIVLKKNALATLLTHMFIYFRQVALLLKVTKTNLVVTKLAAGGHKRDSKVHFKQLGT